MSSLARKGRYFYATWYDPFTRKKHWESLSVFARERGMESPVTTPRLAKRIFEVWKSEGRDKSAPPLAIAAFLNAYKDQARRRLTLESQRVTFNRLEIFRRWGLERNITHLSDISRKVVETFIAGLTCGPVTRYRYVESLRAAFNWGVGQNLITVNPAVGIKREPNYSPNPRRALSEDDAERVLVELPSPDREFCAMALLAGLRRSDIVYLTWDDVDIRGHKLTIRGKPDFPEYSPKSIRYRGRPDEIPISRELATVLRSMPRTGRFVFDNGKGSPLYSDPDSWTRRIRLQLLRLGITSTIHELRHTFITAWAKKGLNPLALRLLARHADISTTLRYTHMTTDDLRKEMETVERG